LLVELSDRLERIDEVLLWTILLNDDLEWYLASYLNLILLGDKESEGAAAAHDCDLTLLI